jgi:hypothetical protein
MAGGIDITACYRIVCDNCQVRAEPDDEYHLFADAHAARDRVAEFDGWLLTWTGGFATLLCPECSAQEDVGPGA